MSNELQQCKEQLDRKEAQIQELLQWQAHLEKDIHQLKTVIVDKDEQIQKFHTDRDEERIAQRDYILKLEKDVSSLQKRLLEVETAENDQNLKSQSVIRRLEESNQALLRKVDLAQLNEEKLKQREAELDELETFKAKYVLLVHEIKNQKFNHLMKVFFTKDYN